MVNIWLISLIVIVGVFILTRILSLDFDTSASIITGAILSIVFIIIGLMLMGDPTVMDFNQSSI